MDIFAHFLWTYIFFRKVKYPNFALFVGIMPDILTWGVMLAYYFLTHVKLNFLGFGSQLTWVSVFGGIPTWVLSLYGITHSLTVFLVVFSALYFSTAQFHWFLLPWPMHILFDIITHSKEHLPTPFLWPLSDFAFPGMRFTELHVIVLNYTLLISALIYMNREFIKTHLRLIKQKLSQLLCYDKGE